MITSFLKIFISLLVISSVMGGCKKSFLDEPRPGTSVASTDVFATDQGVRAYFNGIYRRFRIQYGTAADAWGIASINLAREVKGTDVVLPNVNWYTFDYEHDNREPVYRRVVFTWGYFYDFINQANNLIQGVTASSLSDASKSRFIAEARAIRAWCYFELLREFSHAYVKNPNGPGVPIYLEPATAATRGNPRSSISEVYTLIVDDLKFAVANLGTTRQLKDVINKDVANGILARVYLEMGDWGNAKTTAQAAKASYALNAANYNTPFTSIDKSEVMWGFPQSADQTIFYGTPSAFWGHTGVGYFNFYVDSIFVNTFSATDIRKTNFYTTAFTDFRRWRSSKFGTTTRFEDHFIMMRVAEMWLIEAEAKARLGEADAGDILFTLQKNRDPQAVQSGNTGQDLINEILLERRKELFGEIGISYLDLKRLGLPLERSVGHPSVYRFSIPGNSDRYTLKIPQAEIDANESLTNADQNP
ncbi:MAG: RagB/SusD family nutrient uptake outer membrane protein [Flavisolibacter sp.]|nr:RagB/SusD family nutrient uptake outer membrane protein [Flavisolibacter sp.]